MTWAGDFSEENEMSKRWGIQNTVYLEAPTYERAVDAFWEMMEDAGVGSVMDGDPLPRCFVSEVEECEKSGV